MDSVKEISASALVSVNIPTSNSARTSRQCLESVRSQTYSQIEAVIIDGSSTDETLKIAPSYACKIGFSSSLGALESLVSPWAWGSTYWWRLERGSPYSRNRSCKKALRTCMRRMTYCCRRISLRFAHPDPLRILHASSFRRPRLHIESTYLIHVPVLLWPAGELQSSIRAQGLTWTAA